MKISGKLFILCLCLIISVCGRGIKSKGNQENDTFQDATGLKLRKETATHPQSPRIEASRSIIKEECLKDVWDGEGDASNYTKLGKRCTDLEARPQKRWMLNSNKIYECEQCCSKNYWSTKMKTCIPCSTRNEPNIWETCEYDIKANMIDASTTATLPTTEQPNSTTSTTSLTDSKTIGTDTGTVLPEDTTAEEKNSDPEPTTDSAMITTELPKETTAEGKSDSIAGPIIGGVIAAVLVVLAMVIICRRKELCCFKKRVQQSSTARFSRGESGENRPSSNAEVHSIPEVNELLEDEDGTVEITCEPCNAA